MLFDLMVWAVALLALAAFCGAAYWWLLARPRRAAAAALEDDLARTDVLPAAALLELTHEHPPARPPAAAADPYPAIVTATAIYTAPRRQTPAQRRRDKHKRRGDYSADSERTAVAAYLQTHPLDMPTGWDLTRHVLEFYAWELLMTRRIVSAREWFEQAFGPPETGWVQ